MVDTVDEKRARGRAYYLEHKDKIKAKSAEHYANNREKTKARIAAYQRSPVNRAKRTSSVRKYDQRPESRVKRSAYNKARSLQEDFRNRQRASLLRNKYSLSLADFDTMMSRQDGKCAICRTDDFGGHKNGRCVDHDHATGVVRGVLCHNCNVVLGLIKESPLIAGQIIDYLRQHQMRVD